MKRFQFVKCFLAGALLALSACSPKVDMLGYTGDHDWKTEVVVGKTTKDELLANFGSPSAQSSFGPETWYYVSARKEAVAFLKPEVVDQHVVEIEFDSAGLVSSVKNYSLDDSKDFALVNRTTPTEGHSMSFIEQLLGNVGRFNSPGGAGSIAPGRNPNGGY